MNKYLALFLAAILTAYPVLAGNISPAGSPNDIQIKKDATNFAPLQAYTAAAYAAHNKIAGGTAYDPRDPVYGAICGGYNTFAGDGTTTTFNYTIPFTGSSSTDNTGFMVFYEPTNGGGSATILTTAQFSVTGVNSGSGGTITLNSPVPSGNTLLVVHDDSAGLVAASAAASATGGYVKLPDGCTIYGSQANGTQLAEGTQLIGTGFTQNYGFQGQGIKPFLRVIAPTGYEPTFGINISGRNQQFFEGFEITSNVSPSLASLGFLKVPVLIGANTVSGAGGGQSPGIVVQYVTFNSGSVGFGSPIGGSSGYIFTVVRFSNFVANNAGVYGPLSDQQFIGNNFSANGAFGTFGSAGGMVVGPQQSALGGSGAGRFEFNRFEFNSEGLVIKAGGLISMEGNQFDGNSYCGLDLNGSWNNINVTGGWFRGNGNGGGSYRGTTTAGRDADICFNGTSAGNQGLTFTNVNFLTNYGMGYVNPIGSNNATTPLYVLDMNASPANNDYIEFNGGAAYNTSGSQGAYVSDFAIFRQGRPKHYKVNMTDQAVQGEHVSGKLRAQARGLPSNSWSAYAAIGDQVTYYNFYSAQTLYPSLLNGDLAGSLTNYTVPFGFTCDVVDQKVFPSFNPSQTGNPLISWLPETADPTYGNPSSGSVETVHEAITHSCRMAGLTWLTIPSTYKVYGQNASCVKSGTWSNSSQYGGTYGVVSNTNGDTVTCTITTNGGPVYAWYGLKENDGGTFTYSIDGGSATTLPTNGNNDFSYPVNTHTSVGGIRLPVLSAGSHTVTFTVTSATDPANTVTVYGLGTPPGKAYLGGNPTVFYGGQLYGLNDSAYPTATAAYDTDERTDADQLKADGLGVVFVDVRKYVNATTDMTGGPTGGLVPNSTGQQHIRDAFEGAMQFLPNSKKSMVDPRDYGASCNAKNFINTFSSTDNHVTTTAGSPVISIANYTFVDGVATQNGGGDVGKVISVFGHVDQGPTTYIVSVDTVNNTATLAENMQATRSDNFAAMGGYPTNPSDPSTAQDDTVAIQNASLAAKANGQKVFLPNNCLVHNLQLADGTVLEGSMGGVDYNSASPSNIPVTNLYCASNGYADDPHTCINVANSREIRLKDFQLTCATFPTVNGGAATSFRGLTLAGIGAETNMVLHDEAVVLDHVSTFLCPVGFGVPFAMNQPVSFTASISGNQMTVSSIDSTNIVNIYGAVASPDWLATGRTVTGTGVPANTKILSAPISGGTGVYTLSTSSTVSSESMTSPANAVYLSGKMRFSQFSNNGIDINGDFSDFEDVGSVFTGGFTKCMWLGPNTGGSTGNSANRFALERFEECNNGAIVLDGTGADQFTGIHFQFNSGYAVETKNSWNDIIFTGGTFQGNGTSSTPAPTLAQVALGGTGTNFSIVGSEWLKQNYSGGGNSGYLVSTVSGSNVDYVSIEGGDARSGFNTGTVNWAGNTPSHFKLSVPGLPLVDTTQSTLSQATTGGVAVGRSDSSAVSGQLELGKPGTTAGQVTIDGATSGSVTQKASASTTSYNITWPNGPGTAGTFLKNIDGAGTTDWALPATVHPNVFALFGPLTVGNDLANWVILPSAGTINKALAVCKNAPTGSPIIFDIQKSSNNGASFTSLWNLTPANKLQVASGASAGSTTSFDLTSFAANDILRIDVDQIGSGAAGGNCTVMLTSTY